MKGQWSFFSIPLLQKNDDGLWNFIVNFSVILTKNEYVSWNKKNSKFSWRAEMIKLSLLKKHSDHQSSIKRYIAINKKNLPDSCNEKVLTTQFRSWNQLFKFPKRWFDLLWNISYWRDEVNPFDLCINLLHTLPWTW